MAANPWSFGDRVTHADRPEWGVGQVTAVQPIMVEGRPTQRLTIRFERAGIKTLAAAVANIRKADEQSAPKSSGVEAKPALANSTEATDVELAKKLTTLPESVIDPFIPLAERLATTLGLYRFSDKGGSLLDWAAMQTGLADPLTRILRHELETHFSTFRRALDRHTSELASQLARKDKPALQAVAQKAPDAGQHALRRALARR